MAVSTQRLAKSIVRESLRPKEHEVVLVQTFPHTLELAEQVALECQRLGADPAILLDTDAVFYGQFKHYTQEQLLRTSGHCLGLGEYVNSYVWLEGPRDPGPMVRVPREQFSAMYEGEFAHTQKNLQKLPKMVIVESGLVTRERAKAYGLNYAKWKTMVEAAITVNYRQMEALGKTVAGRLALSSPAEVRITAGNGTDLRFRLAGPERKPAIFDGVISDEDLASGKLADRTVHLPAGEVAIAPIEESARGTFVCDVPSPTRGRFVEGLAWTFDGGRVTDYTAKRNLSFAQTNWPEATGQKDMFGGFGLGLNRKALPGFLENFFVAGMVTIRIGENRDLGGRNPSSYEFFGFLSSATVEIAGKTVIEGGKWVI